MAYDKIETTVEIPQGVTVDVQRGVFTVKGPKGEVTRRLFHPRIESVVEKADDGHSVVLRSVKATQREKKMIYTFTSHVKNLVKGVESGYEYKLKICSGHFPMTVAIKGEKLEVKNFIGEAVPRTLKINPQTKVVVEGAEITVTGNDVELVGQMAASIEQLCKRAGFDRRIFQDGIYITHKDGNPIE